MKKIVLSVMVLIGAASCQEQQKIAFIDNGEIINDYQMKIDIEEKFKIQNDGFTKQRDSIARVYQMEMQSVQQRLSQLSPQKQQEESQVFSQKWQPIQQQMQMQQQQMEQMFNTEMDSVISKMNKFVEGYGKKNGYTFILGKNQAGSVVYGDEATDITDVVIKEINAEYSGKDSKTEEGSTEATTEK
ncbi:Outer membrane protein H precursor [Winogradskyella psychrotolerans RS-3]|uniref:Outer membrane protein H n=1 Tax=Winogradskyella psychrotolerans RS-3 TaxID=641526 RepID=S7XF71_9FLAO|nr:OmpH family outer membrane protein [Winogradskyella psychrotolerans]EPR74648.1 Outer membrane protein H precursor [Winogradskyella psychrotolerans RS-3]